jgi:hypothetical protein
LLYKSMGKHRHKPAVPSSLWADMVREISHFLAGLIILVLINLAPTDAQGKVTRFTDSKGVIHITSAGQEQGEKFGNSGANAPPAGSGNVTQYQAPKPAPIMPSPPAVNPQAEPSPGPTRKGPPPDLGALGHPGTTPQVSQSPRGSGGNQPQATLPESVPYTAAGDPFLNPSMTIRRVAAGAPPLVNVARAAAAPKGGIISFKDRHGVLHISNQADSPEPGDKEYAPASPRPALSAGAVPKPTIRPISWQPDAPGEPAGIDRVSQVDSHLAREPVIRRFRDRQGVMHITNATPAGQPRQDATLAARNVEAMPPGMVRTVQFQSPVDYSSLLKTAEKLGAGPVVGQMSVSSRRDRLGVLRISNAPAQGTEQILASLAYMKKNLGPIIAEATRTYRLPPALVLAVIQAESNFVPQAVSPKGAMGLMQLMPGTASLLGVQDPFNPRENILAGCPLSPGSPGSLQGFPASGRGRL